ncbi:MAG: hypothetical protein Q4E57_06760 [Eubacteriales bacterium]|nr:hypothetical protein [Eubacteriales bacterium]
MKKKFMAASLFGMLIALMFSLTAFAYGWERDGRGWRYNDGGGYYASNWVWIDGNGDNVAECYYFYDNCYMAENTYVGNYYVNQEGKWTVNGVVQTKLVSGTTNSGYNDNLWITGVNTRQVNVEIFNDTGTDIIYAYLSGSNRSDWGSDILGSGILYNWETRNVVCNVNNGMTLFDLQVHDSNGYETTFYNLDFGNRSSVAINLVGNPYNYNAYVVNN